MSSRISQTVSAGPDVNNSRRSQLFTERDYNAGTYKASTISFTNPGTIADSANGLGLYQVNDMIDVRGSPLNSRRWAVLTTGAGSITVQTNAQGEQITTEGAGAAIIISRDS